MQIFLGLSAVVLSGRVGLAVQPLSARAHSLVWRCLFERECWKLSARRLFHKWTILSPSGQETESDAPLSKLDAAKREFDKDNHPNGPSFTVRWDDLWFDARPSLPAVFKRRLPDTPPSGARMRDAWLPDLIERLGPPARIIRKSAPLCLWFFDDETCLAARVGHRLALDRLQIVPCPDPASFFPASVPQPPLAEEGEPTVTFRPTAVRPLHSDDAPLPAGLKTLFPVEPAFGSPLREAVRHAELLAVLGLPVLEEGALHVWFFDDGTCLSVSFDGWTDNVTRFQYDAFTPETFDAKAVYRPVPAERKKSFSRNLSYDEVCDLFGPDLGGIDIRTSGAAYFLWYFDDDTCFVGLAGNPADGRFLRCPPGGYRLSLDHGNRYPLAELVPREAEPGEPARIISSSEAAP